MKYRYIWLLAMRYLTHRRFATIVSIIAIALSLIFVVGSGVVNFAVKKTAVEGSIRYPLVVGPSAASGVQLILSTIFYIDKPTGAIPFSVYEELKSDKRVIDAYPIAVADTFENIRIIGTNEAFLNNLGVGVSAGAIDLSKMEHVVIGYGAADRTELGIGDIFQGQHGMVGDMEAHVHDELTYKVVGILSPTGGPEDMAIYTSYESVWHIHEKQLHHHAEVHDHDGHQAHSPETYQQDGHDERHEHSEKENTHPGHDKYSLTDKRLTAVLVRTANPAYTGALEREYSLRQGTLAIDTGRSIRQFVNHVNKGEVFVEAMSAGMLAIAIIMILVTLIMSLNERRRELALMRSLGIGRGTIAMTVMLEALLITFFGALAGVMLGHLLAWLLKGWLMGVIGVEIEPFVVTRMESWGMITTLIAGQVLALIAMIWTYRMNLVEEIAKD